MATVNSNTSTGYYLQLVVTQSSQSIANNNSTLSWTLYFKNGSSYYQNQSTKDTFKVVINGTTVYNTSKAISFSGANKTLTIASGTTTVGHNADGTKSVSMSCSYTPGKTASYYPKALSGSGSMSLTTIPRASSISASGSTCYPNGYIEFYVSRASSSFTHTITWSCGSSSGTVASGVGTSVGWTVPASLINQSPNGNQTCTIYCYTYNGGTHIGTSSMSFTVTNYGASWISGQSGNTIGSGMSFTIGRNSGLFTHSLWYSFGSVSWAGIGSGLGTSASFTPPMSLCNQIPNATSGSMTVILRTYYGSTQIGGDQYYYYTMNMPSSVVPSFSDVTHVENVSEVSTLVGLYVQNKTKLTCAITGASGSYGSSIASYKITVGGQTINASSGTTGIITVSGNQTLTATITDSRGRTASKSKTVNILPYANPKIAGAGVNRDSDTTALITANLSAASLKNGTTEKNSLKYKIEYKSIDQSSYTENTGSYPSVQSSLSKSITGLNANKSYEFKVYVGDIFGYSNTPEIFKISTAFKSFDFDVKTGRVGIKKVLEHEDSVIEVPQGSQIYAGDIGINLDNILVFIGEE